MQKINLPSNAYVIQQAFMVNELGLGGDELEVYAIIYGFSRDGVSRMVGGLPYFSAWLGKTTQSAWRAVNSLLEKGLIVKYERYEHGIKYCEYTITQDEIDRAAERANAIPTITHPSLPRNSTITRAEQHHHAGGIKNITLDNKDRDNRDIYPSAFDEFWQAYPKHKDKAAAEKSFTKVMKSGVPLETLLTAIERQKKTEQWSRDGGQFIPYPSTWLNRKKWEDEVQDSEIGESAVPKWCITKDEPQYDPDTGELLPF